MTGCGVGRSGLPIPRSTNGTARLRAAALSRSSSANTYDGSVASDRLTRSAARKGEGKARTEVTMPLFVVWVRGLIARLAEMTPSAVIHDDWPPGWMHHSPISNYRRPARFERVTRVASPSVVRHGGTRTTQGLEEWRHAPRHPADMSSARALRCACVVSTPSAA